MPRGRLPPLALAYHAVGDVPLRDDPHPLFVRFEDLSKHVAKLRRWGYSLVSFGDLARLVAARRAEGHVALTFDDGYADNSILPELGVPATVFVVSGWLGQPHRSAPAAPILTADAIRALHAQGIEIGAHTVTHPDLTTLGYEEARSELERSKRELEAVLEAPVEVAAYPYGRANPDTMRAARDAGFRAACLTTGRGSWDTPLQLPRQDVPNSATLLGLRMKRDGHYEPIMRLYPARAVRKLIRGAPLMRFSVVIPTMRREASLAATLASLARCDPLPHEVIVVDSDEQSSSQPVVTEFADAVSSTVHYVQTTPSLIRQRNIGIDDSSGDVIVFLDDDVSIEPDLFARLDDVYRDPALVGATGRVVPPESKRRGGSVSPFRRLLPGGGREGTFTRYGYPRYLRDLDRPHDIEFMQGCFMSARRDAAAAVRFDEQLSGYALAEDEDFSFRISRVGTLRYAPDNVVQHRKLGFGSQDARFGRLVVVNRTYLFRKNFARTPLARFQFGLLVVLLVGHRLVNREWSGARGLLEGSVQAWRAGR